MGVRTISREHVHSNEFNFHAMINPTVQTASRLTHRSRYRVIEGKEIVLNARATNLRERGKK